MKSETRPSRESPLFWLLVAAGVALYFVLVLHGLGAAFERDYDEGVYWQSLRALARGESLYAQIFYSQPPAFLLALYPVYLLFGQTIFAARLGVVLLSFLGLLGALMAGAALRGRRGMVLALFLLVITPFFIAASQTLQADAPSAALMLLTVGAALLWWKHPGGAGGYGLALLTGAALSLGIFCKLLGLAAAVPVLCLALAHVRRGSAGWGSLAAGFAAFALVSIALILPFRAVFSQLWDQVVTFHVAAKAQVSNPLIENAKTLLRFFLRTPLLLTAAMGTLVALLRRDWLLLPVLAWALTLFVLFLQQAPLFHHHLVTFLPPLVLLSLPLLDLLFPNGGRRAPPLAALASLALVIVIGLSLYRLGQNYRHQDELSPADRQTVNNLSAATESASLVVTDSQFLAALAGRTCPGALVDTSYVRIRSGYLRLEQLLAGTADPKVQAVLLTGGRLDAVPGFRSSLAPAFRRVFDYGKGRELWVRN